MEDYAGREQHFAPKDRASSDAATFLERTPFTYAGTVVNPDGCYADRYRTPPTKRGRELADPLSISGQPAVPGMTYTLEITEQPVPKARFSITLDVSPEGKQAGNHGCKCFGYPPEKVIEFLGELSAGIMPLFEEVGTAPS